MQISKLSVMNPSYFSTAWKFTTAGKTYMGENDKFCEKDPQIWNSIKPDTACVSAFPEAKPAAYTSHETC